MILLSWYKICHMVIYDFGPIAYPDCCHPSRLPSSPICTRWPCSSTACLFCQRAVMHMLCTVRNKIHDTEALDRACSAWAIRVSKAQICCSERNIVRPPAPVQITPELPCFIWEFNPVLQEIWSGPTECRPLASSCKYLAKKVHWWRWWPQHRCQASHYRGKAVTVTALLCSVEFILCTVFVKTVCKTLNWYNMTLLFVLIQQLASSFKNKWKWKYKCFFLHF